MPIQYKKKGGYLLISCLASLSFAYAEPQTVCMSEQGTCQCETCENRVIGDTEGLCQSEITIIGDEIKVDCLEPTSPCQEDPNFSKLWTECSKGAEGTRCETTGIYVCNETSGTVYCNAKEIAPTTETCNGLDDDCDGIVDDVANLGTECTGQTVGLGVCANNKGTLVCKNNQTFCEVNSNDSNKQSESCANMGEDNNCDGITDNITDLGKECTGKAVGQGVCANNTGTFVCKDNKLVCEISENTSSTEICDDGLDNDCDGDIDMEDEDCAMYSCDKLDGSSVLNDFYITNNYKVKKTSGSNVGKSFYKEEATGRYNNSDYLSYHVATGTQTIIQQGKSTADYGYTSDDPYSIANIVCIKNPNGIKKESGQQWEKIIGDKENQGITQTEIKYNYNDVETQYRDLDMNILNGMSVKDQYKNSKACYLCAVGRNQGCFSPETLIALADGSQKQAKEIAVGDKLFNPVTRSAVTVKRVIEGPEPIGLVSIKFKDGKLKVSQDHPMLTANGLKPAKELKAGEIIFNGDNEKITVEEAKILPVEEGQWVVNFLLEGADMTKSENRMLLSDGIISGDLQTQLELSIVSEK